MPRELPDPARVVAEAISVTGYRYRAIVKFGVSAEEVAKLVPPNAGPVEERDGAATLTIGVDDAEWLTGYLLRLGLPFEVISPPELRERSGLCERVGRDRGGPCRRGWPDTAARCMTGTVVRRARQTGTVRPLRSPGCPRRRASRRNRLGTWPDMSSPTRTMRSAWCRLAGGMAASLVAFGTTT